MVCPTAEDRSSVDLPMIHAKGMMAKKLQRKTEESWDALVLGLSSIKLKWKRCGTGVLGAVRHLYRKAEIHITKPTK